MTAPIKTCNYCRAVGVMPTFMNGETVCYDCLLTLPKTLREAWREIVSLRAKVAEMEKQEPVATVIKEGDSRYWMSERERFEAWARQRWTPPEDFDQRIKAPSKYNNYEVQAAWEAWQERAAQPVPNAVAYLDLGVGGYMDIGTDLTDEELAALPKGRHMLGIIGTYGVDGYVPAHPAPSVPDGWLPVPEKHPTFDPVDLQLSDGSVLCGCVPQVDGDYWWEGPSGEVFIDPKYASATHWRLAVAPETNK